MHRASGTRFKQERIKCTVPLPRYFNQLYSKLFDHAALLTSTFKYIYIFL